ncbi:MAG: sulfatase [Breznakibacter sp.]|nr:sulfatase [Breznakibacter sp.]
MKLIRQVLSNRMSYGTLGAGALLSATGGVEAQTGVKSDRQPNIVLIVTDDLAFSDMGCYGADDIATPNLDSLAHNGVRFTNFYAAQAVSSASRAAMMTGCYPARVGLQGALTPGSPYGINESETTVAEMLLEAGYATGMVGKWHLGDIEQFLPTQHGFQSYFGIPYSNDMWPYHPQKIAFPPLPLMENNRVVKILEDQTELTTWYTDRATRFIDEHHDRPFFLYLAHNMPHVPLYVSDKFKGKSNRGLYGDVIMEIDWSVGEVMKALRKYGIDENTLVIFTSDNGPWLSYGDHAGCALPLREGKHTTWDGGHRVPCIVSWPAAVAKNMECQQAAMNIDFLPTIAQVSGAKLPDKPIDGKTMMPLLTNPEDAVSQHEALYFYYETHLQAVRSGKWKLHLPHSYSSLNGRSGGKDGMPVPYETLKTDWTLYDLGKDISESNNLYGQFPEVELLMKGFAGKAADELGNEKNKGYGQRKPGYAPGYVYEPQKVTNLAVGAEVSIVAPFKTFEKGNKGLLADGITGTMQHNDGCWLGFNGDDMDAVLKLKSPVQATSISVNFLNNPLSWIFEPVKVDLYYSVDGKKFKKVEVVTRSVQEVSSCQIVTYSALVSRKVSKLKVVAKSIGMCPQGHAGYGSKAWMFADEVVVK